MKKFLILLFALSFIYGFRPTTIIGTHAGTGGSSSHCPPWYAESIASWNGKHTSGENYLCETDGTARNADTDTATVTDQGTYWQLELDDTASAAEYLRWNRSYTDGNDEAVTMCVELYMSQRPAAAIRFFESSDNVNDAAWIEFDSTQDRIKAQWYSQGGTAASAFGGTLATGSWVTIAYSWDTTGATDDHSANPGDGAPWSAGWEEDLAELTFDMTDAATQVSFGNYLNSNAFPTNQYAYLRQWAIVSGYEQDCTALTGW